MSLSIRFHGSYIALLAELLLHSLSFSSGIHKDLREYEWEDIYQIGLVSNAAYYYFNCANDVKTSMEELEQAGWACKLIGDGPFHVIRAEYGPLVVLGFKGTTKTEDYASDLNAIRLTVTESEQQGVAHRGIYSYTKKLPASINALFNPDDGDELLVLAGHSLGGAVAQLKG
ncbi:hypothetical protein IM40_02605 [Candidatus Paracaedimonas acanthamoebae]|nr:hypothetical protein IM40_02605 [Candidatus Paracaedimonas acanthamoebae]